LALTADKEKWLFNSLLPVIYWKQHVKKSKRKSIKSSCKKTFQLAEQSLLFNSITNFITDERLNALETWARWISTKFQRTNSAIEGRNSLLSLAYSSTRGLSKERLKSLTVISNYVINRDDKTTSSERFAEIKPSCLLTYIMDNIGEFSIRRDGKEKINTTFYLQDVAA